MKPSLFPLPRLLPLADAQNVHGLHGEATDWLQNFGDLPVELVLWRRPSRRPCDAVREYGNPLLDARVRMGLDMRNTQYHASLLSMDADQPMPWQLLLQLVPASEAYARPMVRLSWFIYALEACPAPARPIRTPVEGRYCTRQTQSQNLSAGWLPAVVYPEQRIELNFHESPDSADVPDMGRLVADMRLTLEVMSKTRGQQDRWRHSLANALLKTSCDRQRLASAGRQVVFVNDQPTLADAEGTPLDLASCSKAILESWAEAKDAILASMACWDFAPDYAPGWVGAV